MLNRELVVGNLAVFHADRAFQSISILIRQSNVVVEQIMPGVGIDIKHGIGALGDDVGEGLVLFDFDDAFLHGVNIFADFPRHQRGGMVSVVLGCG